MTGAPAISDIQPSDYSATLSRKGRWERHPLESFSIGALLAAQDLGKGPEGDVGEGDDDE